MSDPNSTHPDRRTFLQIAGALVGASVTGASTEGAPAVALSQLSPISLQVARVGWALTIAWAVAKVSY